MFSGCYPFSDKDPLILESCPHVYFAGNMPEFKHKLHKGKFVCNNGEEIICSHVNFLDWIWMNEWMKMNECMNEWMNSLFEICMKFTFIVETNLYIILT